MFKSVSRVLILVSPIAVFADTKSETQSSANLADRYRNSVNGIIDSALAGNDAYQNLEYLCTRIGHRLSGSTQLDQAINWAMDTMKNAGQENVHREKVMVPHWVRGKESITMLEPRREELAMMGLGGSVGTPHEGIIAPVIVVHDEDEFTAAGDALKGKIVLFDNAMHPYDPEHGSGYGTAVRFRTKGASLAASHGAVASLIRSVTARSLRSPHTGALRYEKDFPQIPSAAVSVEDAELISRISARGTPVVLNLKMEGKSLEEAESANTIGELRGSTNPEEIVVVSGHLDSWDVGQGALDDGGGCAIAMESINVLRKLNLRPRRTIRVVLWTNEENGLAGAKAYAKDHADEMRNHVTAVESDGGVFKPAGFSVECKDEKRQAAGAETLKQLMPLLSRVGAMKIDMGHSGADVGVMSDAGVVLLGHNVEGATYFDYHHTQADTIDKINPDELNQNVAVLTAVLYLIADMPERIGS
ncbi:MAG: M20/M25/M40 family metallo-hydrolase [Planctomycetes bacterium]|nr:M20/M25/M40 family metallo-hydrolase [Planctomycetota bacterium]MBI3833737.1 M20/M25/M40 family metallo-hydrolase [Planctomycetota bacterium]